MATYSYPEQDFKLREGDTCVRTDTTQTFGTMAAIDDGSAALLSRRPLNVIKFSFSYESSNPRQIMAGSPKTAFPYDNYLPALIEQPRYLFLVALNILSKFVLPFFIVLVGSCRILAALMPMPETAVHEYRDLVSGKHDVRLARQPAGVKPISKAFRVKKTSHLHLGLGVAALYAGHHSRANSGIDYVNHSW